MNMELNRRSFLKGAGVIGALGAAGALGAGCSPAPQASVEKSEGEPKAMTPNETIKNAASEPTDGKYVAKAIGHESYVFVEATVKDGALANLQVLSHDETPGIGSLAAKMWPAKALESQNLDVDAISGATTTCNAIQNAALECLANAGLDVADFQKGPEERSGGSEQTIETDVVIMGAGTAGLTAATRLLEKGVRVTLFEKQDIPGGSMSMTYSGLASAGSTLQKNYSLGRFDDNPNFNKDAMLKLLSAYVNPEFDRFDGAMPYDDAMYTTSASLVDWLHEIGVGFYSMGVSTAYGITPYLAPGCYEGGCGQAMQFLVDRIGALGGTIVYGATVTDIVMDGERAAGLVAEGKDGSVYTATAKAVLLASGGFGANQDMVDQYYPQYAGRSFNCCPASTGDGIVLGQKAGAAIECMGRELGAYMSTTGQAGSRMEVAFMYQTTPGIMVNAHGDQFGNVMRGNHFVIGAALCDEEANGGKFYWITDESGAVTTMNNLTWGFDTYKAIFERGDMVHYSTVEEAAEATGCANLAATLETHNQHALAGEADEFKREKLPYLDTHDGVWVCGIEPTFYLTTGGLAIDTSCHVTREDGSTIEGLYAAGDVCGSIEEKDGKQYGMGFDAAMNFGYIMAETVAAEMA